MDGNGEPETDVQNSKKRKGRPKSRIWDFYLELKADEVPKDIKMVEGEEYVSCNIMTKVRANSGQWKDDVCGKIVKYKNANGNASTSSMLDHVVTHGYNRNTLQLQGGQQTKFRKKDGVLGLDHVPKWSPQSPEARRITVAIAKWFAIDGLAPNNVSKSGFKEFMEYVLPSYPGTTPATVTRYITALHRSFVVG